MKDVQPLEQELPQYEELRAAVDSQLTSYVQAHFQKGVTCTFATEKENGNTCLVICINSTYTRPRAMWYVPFDNFSLMFSLISTNTTFCFFFFYSRGGRWKSTWMIELAGESCPVKGQISVDAHFYEAGNVHFHTTKEPSGSLKLGV